MIAKNNPFNIVSRRNKKRLGQISTKKGLCVFSSLYFGIRAALWIYMFSYRIFGIKSIHDICYRITFDDDLEKCIVSKTKIPPLKELNSEMDYAVVLKAMSEYFGNPVTLEDILSCMEHSKLHMSVF